MINGKQIINSEEDGSLPNNTNNEKVHSWRRCYKGKHFVKEYVNSAMTTVHNHCASNPSHKDELSYDEIQYITKTYFGQLSGLPTIGVLEEYKDADTYDFYICGWVCYWNDIFKPSISLDVNFIKALIATESGFRENPPENSHAHGLMQLLYETFLILQDTKGELSDYLIRIPWNKILDHTSNICMGVRWLFQKRKLLEARLKREVTWEEAVIEYKSYWDYIKKHSGKMPDGIIRLREFYQRLKNGG
jgi:hypothetical protein